MDADARSVIEEWMDETVESGSWAWYDDLHIDEVIGRRLVTLRASLQALAVAVRLRDVKGIDLGLHLGISLLDREEKTGFDFSGIDSLESELDHTPPCLYLFDPDVEDWKQTVEISVVVVLDDVKDCGGTWHYWERLNDDGEYRRVVFVAVLPGETFNDDCLAATNAGLESNDRELALLDHCCAQMRADLLQQCDIHPNRHDCPDALIDYSEQFDEYGIIVHDGGTSTVKIRFCPWCGARLPESKRDRWFDALQFAGVDSGSDTIPEEFHSAAWYRDRG